MEDALRLQRLRTSAPAPWAADATSAGPAWEAAQAGAPCDYWRGHALLPSGVYVSSGKYACLLANASQMLRMTVGMRHVPCKVARLRAHGCGLTLPGIVAHNAGEHVKYKYVVRKQGCNGGGRWEPGIDRSVGVSCCIPARARAYSNRQQGVPGCLTCRQAPDDGSCQVVDRPSRR
jgi:hypothetical protein